MHTDYVVYGDSVGAGSRGGLWSVLIVNVVRWVSIAKGCGVLRTAVLEAFQDTAAAFDHSMFNLGGRPCGSLGHWVNTNRTRVHARGGWGALRLLLELLFLLGKPGGAL